jgi:hypothetical protein
MVRLSSTRGRTLRALAAIAVLTTAACTDDATSPLVRAPQSDALASHNAGHLHTGKYRDSGAPHATGRSGSARLAARAHRGADGVTRLLVTTGSVDDPRHAPGELAKVQLKVYDPDGRRLYTQNHQRPSSDGWHEFVLPGLARGSRIDVQANVRGIDRNRTDVVEVSSTVVAAPSFVVNIDPPAEVVAGVPTVITGTVTETGGDAGGYASCVLYVDGVVVDRIDGIWVDAGDVVTCAFTHTFAPGPHNVEVRLEGTGGGPAIIGPQPRDGGMVNAVNPNPVPTWTLSAEDRMTWIQELYSETARGLDGWTRTHDQDTGVSPRVQSLSLVASVARATTFPLATVDLEVWSDAGPWHAETWSGLNAAAPDGSGQSCVNQLIPEHGAHFYLCSTGSGATGTTAYGYTRFAGTITYHSIVFGREWNEFTGQEFAVWSWNNESEADAEGGQRRPMGTQISVRLDVTDGVGTLPVNATVPLTSFDLTTVVTPYTCRDELIPWLPGIIKTVCEGTNHRVFGVSGTATG